MAEAGGGDEGENTASSHVIATLTQLSNRESHSLHSSLEFGSSSLRRSARGQGRQSLSFPHPSDPSDYAVPPNAQPHPVNIFGRVHWDDLQLSRLAGGWSGGRDTANGRVRLSGKGGRPL